MKVGIYGYGNLGRGVECAARDSGDKIVGIFTRRDPRSVTSLTGAPVYNSTIVEQFADKTDVMLICGGSATDLPAMTPALARSFNAVDAYDDHARMTEHISRVNTAAKKSGHTALVGCGWDPGLFSLARLYFSAFFSPDKVTTYWGRGVSQGHSDAIRRVEGVQDARQYTVPVPEALEKVRAGLNPELTTRQKHTRECFVVLEDHVREDAIETFEWLQSSKVGIKVISGDNPKTVSNLLKQINTKNICHEIYFFSSGNLYST